ncbi:hypothetical protein [Kitasatospora cathayae]|uniref:Uncharacterized protein n=1 Tax=Kitasatospora cathayae TaxID=3004092 RepID=A0ABY7QGK9_9ACTN|nr:hypothetical protein [Kitasatospora sp. HUAS 3-15]WBP91906.1 hypothetical protein O1G21_01740 [Kitasatospora sp. HUAS 3-15]
MRTALDADALRRTPALLALPTNARPDDDGSVLARRPATDTAPEVTYRRGAEDNLLIELVLGLGDAYLGAPAATPLDPRHRLVTTKYNPGRIWTAEGESSRRGRARRRAGTGPRGARCTPPGSCSPELHVISAEASRRAGVASGTALRRLHRSPVTACGHLRKIE